MAIAGGVVLATLLTACDPINVFSVETVHIRLTAEGTVDVVVCEPITVLQGRVEVRHESSEPATLVWRSEDRGSVEAGRIWTLGKSPFGLSSTVDTSVVPTQDETIAVWLQGDDEMSAWGEFRAEDLHSNVGYWLDMEGNRLIEPCPLSTGEPSPVATSSSASASLNDKGPRKREGLRTRNA